MEWILAYRLTALRFTRRFTRSWHLRMSQEEVQSLADFALCEASHGFRPNRNTLFSSYLFLCVRRLAHRVLADQIRQTRVQSTLEEFAKSEIPSTYPTEEGSDDVSPEQTCVRTQAQGNLRQALLGLDAREREVITALYLEEVTITALSRSWRCSRMYLYTVRQRALARLQESLTSL